MQFKKSIFIILSFFAHYLEAKRKHKKQNNATSLTQTDTRTLTPQEPSDILLDEQAAITLSLIDYAAQIDAEPLPTPKPIIQTDGGFEETKSQPSITTPTTPARKRHRRGRRGKQTTNPSTQTDRQYSISKDLAKIYRDLKIYGATALCNLHNFKAALKELLEKFPTENKNPIVLCNEKYPTLLIAMIYNENNPRFQEEALPYLRSYVPLLQPDEINSLDDDNDAAVELAIRFEEEETLQVLLQNPHLDISGRNLVRKSYERISPAHELTLFSYLMRTKPSYLPTVLAYRPEILNTQNGYGETPLMVAFQEPEFHEYISLLLACPALDVTLESNCGQTALFYAIEALHRNPTDAKLKSAFKILITHPKMVICKTNDDGLTPYLFALKLMGSSEVADLFERCHPDTILAQAKIHEDVKTAYNIPADYLSPIHLLIARRKPALLKKLLERNQNIKLSEITDRTDASPLHFAVARNAYRSYLYLLEHGANPNITCEQGLTPLMLHVALPAEQERDIQFVYTTVDHPLCDRTKKDDLGLSALEYACVNDYAQALQVLLKAYPATIGYTDLKKFARISNAPKCLQVIEQHELKNPS